MNPFRVLSFLPVHLLPRPRLLAAASEPPHESPPRRGRRPTCSRVVWMGGQFVPLPVIIEEPADDARWRE